MHTDSWQWLRATALVSWAVLSTVPPVLATPKELLTGQGGVSVPLQQVIRVERVRGPVHISIPVAYVFGMGGDRSPYYCSPSIRASNSSNYPVEELIVGISYKTEKGNDVGSSITSYSELKVGRDYTHYFYQLATQDCRGLKGEVTIMRCVYTTGEDCTADTRVTGFGAIPLSLKH